jgi:hypothetical protein
LRRLSIDPAMIMMGGGNPARAGRGRLCERLRAL